VDCPHCGKDADPTLLYCKFCGMAVELDEVEVAKHIERNEERDAVEIMEQQTRIAVYVTAFLLVVVIAFRLIVVRPVTGEVAPGYYAPTKIVDDKGIDPPAALDLPTVPVEIPDDDKK
jgi:hypothetical protein